MGIAAEGDGVPALLVPPTQQCRVERHDGADLQGRAALRGEAQHMSELLLEALR
jgi:hypothetical protein